LLASVFCNGRHQEGMGEHRPIMVDSTKERNDVLAS
jgi:hypothetical protein